MLDALAAKFGFIRKSDVVRKLQFARSVGKRLDEHREVVEAIEAKTVLFDRSKGYWHAAHMAIQDDCCVGRMSLTRIPETAGN